MSRFCGTGGVPSLCTRLNGFSRAGYVVKEDFFDSPYSYMAFSAITFYNPVTNHDNFLPGRDSDPIFTMHFCITY
jgi:hypothetical protein